MTAILLLSSIQAFQKLLLRPGLDGATLSSSSRSRCHGEPHPLVVLIMRLMAS